MPSPLFFAPSRKAAQKIRRRRKMHRLGQRRQLLVETLEDRRLLASIAGQVVYDFDGDSSLDKHEPRLPGWEVYIDLNNNAQFDDGEPSAVTDTEGRYEFDGLGPGFYVLRVLDQPGWTQTLPVGNGKHTVSIRNVAQQATGVDFGQQRLFTPFTPGNLLVTRSSLVDDDLLIEYTPSGQMVQAIVIPPAADGTSLVAKDLVIDAQGHVQIFQSSDDDTRLATFDPITASFSETLVPDWDLGRTFDHWGDIAAFGPYVFANEQLADHGTANGVIRFDTRDASFRRFSAGFGLPTDLTVGLDGLLYTLNATINNTTILVHNPETMTLVRSLNIPQRLQSLAVGPDGALYALSDTGLKLYTPDGTLVAQAPAINGLDISISQDGLLAITAKSRLTLVTPPDLPADPANPPDPDNPPQFAVVASFPILGSVAENYLAYAAFVQDPVGATAADSEIDYGVFHPGKILITNSPAVGGPPQLLEYTPFGELVQQYDLPMHEPGGARDLTTDALGNVRVFNGTFAPRLTTFDSRAGGFVDDDVTFAGWSTANVPTLGGIAAYRNYLYATDTKTQNDARTDQGIVRYNLATGTFERFHSAQGGIIDLTIGLDGLLYTLGPAGSSIGTVVRQYHPVTMELLKTIALPSNHRAIAVDSDGDIFAANPDIQRYRVDSNLNRAVAEGAPLSDRGLGEASDIDLDADGRLLVSFTNGYVLLTDREFTGVFSFLTRASDGMNFAAFVSPSRPLPAARWDAFDVPRGSADNELDVLANDSGPALGQLSITAVGTPSAGGTVVIVGNSLLSYTPPTAPDFVGVETFTYTIADGLGGTDQGLVQITVQGNGNYFVFDDSYTMVEDDPFPLRIPAQTGLLANDGLPDIFPVLTPGNLLVTHSPTGTSPFSLLQEYTPQGVLVRSVQLPSFTGGSADVRDLVVDRQGRIQIYNGTGQPRLTTYDPVTDTLAQRSFPGWNTMQEKAGGGLAAWRNFVFATDQLVSGENPLADAGILRFDIETGAAQRFVDDGNFIDLTVGPDGLLYALGPGGVANSRFIRVYNPSTMARLRQISNLPGDLRAITVAANGDIFGVRNSTNTAINPFVYRYNSSGIQIAAYRVRFAGGDMPPGEADFNDIDLSEDGTRLLIANINQSNAPVFGDGDVILFDLRTQGATILQAPDSSSDMKSVAWVRAPVGTVNGPLTVVSYTQPVHGTLDCEPDVPGIDGLKADGSFCYVPNPDFFGDDTFFYVVSDADGRLRGASVTVTVLPENDPPVLSPADPPLYFVSDEDTRLTLPLSALINGGPGTATITDADRNDPLGGIAITELTGPGVWSYSLDGRVFVDISPVNGGDALHLPASAEIRFTPFGGSGGTARATFLAWDGTVGNAGGRRAATHEILECPEGVPLNPDTLLCGDGSTPVLATYVTSTAYSQDEEQRPVTDMIVIDLLDLPDAPVLAPSNPVMGATDEHTPFDTTIGQFVTGVFDPDGGSELQGVVLVSTSGLGFWEYSLDGVVYLPMPALSSAHALALHPDDHVRYTPDNLNGEVATLTYRAWDKADGATAGDIVDASRAGGATAYSAATDTAWLEVADINDAPILTPQSPIIGTTDVVTPLKVALNTFVRGITDVDRNAVIGGIAITGVSGQGVWAYSLNGVTFQNFPPLNASAALLLRRADMIRYTPAGGQPELARIIYQAWDATQGSPGMVVDASHAGGETAFSLASDQATLTVKIVNQPPVIGGVVGPIQYVEHAPPIGVFPAATVSDATSADFAGGRLVAQIVSGATSSDRLAIRAGNGISLAGDTVIYDDGAAHLVGDFAIDGWVLTVNLTTPEATSEAVQALVRAIVYENVSDNPTVASRRIVLSLTDGDGGNDTGTATQTVTIQPINDPPVAVDDEYRTYIGQTLTINRGQGVLANDVDPEGAPLAAWLVAPPLDGEVVLNPDGSFTYQPDPLFYGRDSFTYKAWDGELFSDDVRVAIDVRLRMTSPAHPADVNADGFLSPLDALLVANHLLGAGPGPLAPDYEPPPFVDYDGDGAVTQADVDGVAAAIDAGGARPVPPPALIIPQTPSSAGPDRLARILLRTTDAAGIEIASINAQQRFFLEAWVADERASPWGVAAAYVDVAYPSALVEVVGPVTAGPEFSRFRTGQIGPAGLIGAAGGGRTTPLPDHGAHLLWRIELVALGGGAAAFTAEAAPQTLAAQTLLFGLDMPLDPSVNITYQGATLHIKGPPVANDDAYFVDEDTPLEATVAAGVLANDIDAEGQPLTAIWVAGPEHGTLTLSPAGSFTYLPDRDFFGVDTFTYRAHNGLFDSNLATVTITVRGVNDPPTAVVDRYSVLRNQTLHVSAAAGLLVNDADVDGDALEVVWVEGPAHGVLTWRPDGSFDYTPDAGFGGADHFSYKVSDGELESNIATVQIDVVFDWRNPYHPVDVNGDGYASPLDALLIFNEVARHGVRALPKPPVPPDAPPPFLDFNGDGVVANFDGYKVLEDLNARGSRPLPDPKLQLPQPPPPLGVDPLVGLRLEAVDAHGRPLSTVNAGETFYLNVYAADLRPTRLGVFSAYLDVALVGGGLKAAGAIEFGVEFPNVRTGSTATPGLLDELGGTRSALPSGAAELLLARVPLRGTAAGPALIEANPADVLPAGQVTLYGIDAPIPTDRIQYGNVGVTVVLTDTDGDGVGDVEEDGAPYNGDGNRDAIPDREQANVASVRGASGYATFAATAPAVLRQVSAVPSPDPASAPANVQFPLGLFQLEVAELATGQTTLTLYLQPGTVANTYYRYGPTPEDPQPHWYPFLFDGVSGAIVHSDRIELRLAAGQRGDDGLVGAGIAFGPGGPGLIPTPWVNPRNHLDVNNSGDVTPVDVLTLINELNRTGTRDLPLVPPAGHRLPPFLDTNGDNRLDPADVLNIVNYLNSRSSGGEGESVATAGAVPGSAEFGGLAGPDALPIGDRAPTGRTEPYARAARPSVLPTIVAARNGRPSDMATRPTTSERESVASSAGVDGHLRDTSAWTLGPDQPNDADRDIVRSAGSRDDGRHDSDHEGLDPWLDEIAADIAEVWNALD